MIYKNKGLITTIFIILCLQVFIYINNSQKSSFRFFVWDSKEIRLGKLISISFVTGFFVSTLLNNIIIKNGVAKTLKNNDDNLDENENLKNFVDDEYTSNIEMPPERDIRDPQPTISVNYRVIKNTDNYEEPYEDILDNKNYRDDWTNNDNDW